MIKSAQNYPISQLFDIESNWVYQIPKYQREYTWQKYQWEALFDDLLDNDVGYYLGSIICINQTNDTFEIQLLELVDGQQRLITLSLLLAAIYYMLNSNELELDDDQRSESANVRRKLVLKGKTEQVRLIPQIQNQNDQDFYAALGNLGLIKEREYPQFAANRRIFRAYRYFLTRIRDIATNADKDTMYGLEELLEKVNRACMVKIEVDSHADAYTLFESLNNRGIPLNAIDLIKNKLLASTDTAEQHEVDSYFERWVRLLGYLGDDYATQERFFRHYYNAFKSDLAKTIHVPMATRANLIRIYEKLIESDAEKHLDTIVDAGRVYSHIIANSTDSEFSGIADPILELERIQGTPSHVLLLHLMVNRNELELTDEDLVDVINSLVKFFVRRNLTDTPATRDLTRIFMDAMESIGSNTGHALTSFIDESLRGVSASDDDFRDKLLGPVYLENAGVTRFILCTLAENAMTLETKVDLWYRRNNQFVWTIEHVMPQGQQLPQAWIDMMGNGNAEKALEVQSTWAHKFGNLTISGFNSTLGNKSFQEKRDRVDSEGRPMGYRNGLSLNRDLAKAETWSTHQIDNRTQSIVDQAMGIFSFGSP